MRDPGNGLAAYRKLTAEWENLVPCPLRKGNSFAALKP